MIEELIEDIAAISHKIKSNEPLAITEREKQAAITMITMEKNIIELINEGMGLKTIVMSLFYFWITLEAPLYGVSTKQLDNWITPLPDAFMEMTNVIQKVLADLPDVSASAEIASLGEKLEQIKSLIDPDELDKPLSPDELTNQVTNVNTRIHKVTSDLLTEHSVHPQILGNVLFSNWLRLSTIGSNVKESYYQKMGYYFSEIIKVARDIIPRLF